jgi:antiviral helicase SKI2
LFTLPKLNCDVCLPRIEDLYDASNEITNLNQHLLELASNHPQGLKLLSSGRVVILRDGVCMAFHCSIKTLIHLVVTLLALQHFSSNAGVWLKAAPFQTSAAGVLDHVKHYFVLALVTAETKTHAQGEFVSYRSW